MQGLKPSLLAIISVLSLHCALGLQPSEYGYAFPSSLTWNTGMLSDVFWDDIGSPFLPMWSRSPHGYFNDFYLQPRFNKLLPLRHISDRLERIEEELYNNMDRIVNMNLRDLESVTNKQGQMSTPADRVSKQEKTNNNEVNHHRCRRIQGENSQPLPIENTGIGEAHIREKDLAANRRLSEKLQIAKYHAKGYSPREIQVRVSDNQVHVTGKRLCSCEEDCIIKEFSRVYPLPWGIKLQSVSATLDKDGWLVIDGLNEHGDKNENKIAEKHLTVIGTGILQKSINSREKLKECLANKNGIRLQKMDKPAGKNLYPSRDINSKRSDISQQESFYDQHDEDVSIEVEN